MAQISLYFTIVEQKIQRNSLTNKLREKVTVYEELSSEFTGVRRSIFFSKIPG